MENTGSYYRISHLVLITGLSDRTIRNHITSGILQGEKINGLWHFSAEQVENYVRHPAVRPSILAKSNALVCDFLLDTKKAVCETCIMLDIPGANEKELAEYFCCRINTEDFTNIHFSFDGVNPVPRVIIKGDTATVLMLVSEYTQKIGL